MKIAVMQPYVFPYLGYFQLIHSVDKFVFYDDVNFIKSGWINRNRILVNKNDYLFTIPLKDASSFRLINETEINHKFYETWKNKFLITIKQSYSKAPFFEETNRLIQEILSKNYSTISELAISSIVEICKHLNLPTVLEKSSEKYFSSKGMDKADRLVEICSLNSSNIYINPSGGKELYNKDFFKLRSIELLFIKNNLKSYNQLMDDFKSGLSIIDILMFNSITETKQMISDYTLE